MSFLTRIVAGLLAGFIASELVNGEGSGLARLGLVRLLHDPAGSLTSGVSSETAPEPAA